eukprot:TRINITY_DN8670_c0_g1_i1.p1 TRINITY_DN8670_c0_g1~~TRINITY_DN8670_c0_g1_i1.p1  ORF type:complete len:512 (+),score=139.00 TRINITY_DN8670_c0_g1_i1:43-1536(+)
MSTDTAPVAPSGDESFLSPELLAQSGIDENNSLVVESKKRKAEEPADDPPPEKKRLTQRQRKRYAQLQAKIAKEKARKSLYAEAMDVSVSTEQVQYLMSSRTLGTGTFTKKEKLKRALLEEKGGLERTDASLNIYQEKEVNDDGAAMPVEETPMEMFQFIGELPEPTLKRKWTTKEKPAKAPNMKKTFFTYDDDEESDDNDRAGGMSDSDESDESDAETDGGVSKRRKIETAVAKAALSRAGADVGDNLPFVSRVDAFDEYYKEGGSDEEGSMDLEEEEEEIEAPTVIKVKMSVEATKKLRENQAKLQRQKSLYSQVSNRDDLFARVERSLAAKAESGVRDVFEEITRPGALPLLKPGERKSAFYVQVDRTAEIQEQRMQLPIIMEEQSVMANISQNDVIILCGQTGSGKTTQVPQFLFEAGYGDPRSSMPGMIGITEPRRVAAVSMAGRVSEELNVGPDRKGLVAHQVRYDSSVNSKTRMKFMTDGILLREIQQAY